ncbi:MAG: hypothetical protein FWG29_03885 [Treponema sp.]|nr:hypothetical protein [Treponema sp.]
MELNALEAQEKNKSTLKFRITFFFVFFLSAVFAVFMITSVLQVNTVIQFVGAHYARPPVDRAQNLINPESFEKLAKSLNPSDPYYSITQQRLYGVKQDTDCLYLYTMAQEEGTIFNYIIDGSDRVGGEKFSPIGMKEDLDEWDSAAMKAFTTGTVQYGTIDKTEEYGSTISVYQPIIKKSGEVVGLIACDIAAEEIVEWIHTQVLWQLIIVFVLFSVGLIVYVTLIDKVNKSFALEF